MKPLNYSRVGVHFPHSGSEWPIPRSRGVPSLKGVAGALLRDEMAFFDEEVGLSLYGRNGYREQWGIWQSSRPSAW